MLEGQYLQMSTGELLQEKTVLQAQELGLEIEVVQTSEDRLVCVHTDLDFYKDSRARTLASSANRIAELDLSWDLEQLLEDVDQMSIKGLWTDAELERLWDSLDLTTFEAMASDNEADETDNESGSAKNKSSSNSNKPESDLLPFHVLLTQQQRERLFHAIMWAKIINRVDGAATVGR